MNVASWAALMSNRSVAASPATASEERWKIARRYTSSATIQTTQASRGVDARATSLSQFYARRGLLPTTRAVAWPSVEAELVALGVAA